MTEQPKRRGGWPGPRKPAVTFKPDADALAAIERYMERHGLSRSLRGNLTKAVNAMLTTHPDARTAPARPDATTGGTPTDTEEPQP